MDALHQHAKLPSHFMKYSAASLGHAAIIASKEGNGVKETDIEKAFIQLMRSTTIILDLLPKKQPFPPNYNDLRIWPL